MLAGSNGHLVVAAVTEHAAAANVGLFLLFFLRSGLSSGSATGGSGATSSSSEGSWVGEVVLEWLSLGEREGLALDGNGDQSLERVVDRVWDRRERWEANGKRHGGHVAETSDELGAQVLLGQVQHGRVEERAVVVHPLDDKTIREWTDVELLEEHGFGVADLVALLGDQHLGHDFNLTLLNLRGHLQSLEEGSLTRIATSWAWWDDDIDWGNSANTSRSWHLVRVDDFTDQVEVTVGEHEADVALDVWQHLLKWVAWVGLEEVVEHLAHEGVLAHQDISLAAQSHTDLLHLVRADIVNVHQEDLGVVLEESLELGKVFLLTFLRDAHGESAQSNLTN
ncbi:TPA: hypothetical protein N0F65_004183 [Lagenidium giganteum]|uniref:Uncharacterized protein n=1 Tax=Lagenidium giganteum TaxID=4803 RepID=A0AAV2YHU0_9STRA|nr:TPA: hypothetical protein N0F65_004183 [Lagenidium giganteum]